MNKSYALVNKKPTCVTCPRVRRPVALILLLFRGNMNIPLCTFEINWNLARQMMDWNTLTMVIGLIRILAQVKPIGRESVGE